jgi:hypothetical protein
VGTRTYVFGEVAHLAALPALDSLSRARLRALLGVVALLLAIAAGERVDTWLRTVAGTMAILFTVNTLDDGTCLLNLNLLLLAVLANVAEL